MQTTMTIHRISCTVASSFDGGNGIEEVIISDDKNNKVTMDIATFLYFSTIIREAIKIEDLLEKEHFI